MSFLYVEDYEVRHELVVRVKDLEEWIDLDYDVNATLNYDDLNKIKEKVTSFLIKRNKVEIDGKIPQPILDKANFIEVKLSGIQILDEKTELKYSSVILGVIFVYPQNIPQRKSTLGFMSDKINKIPTVSQDPAGPMPHDLTT